MSSRATGPTSRNGVRRDTEAFHSKVLPFPGAAGGVADELQFQAEVDALEREISSDENRPLASTLALVVERLSWLTGAEGAAIALRDERGLFCGASQGQAPDAGSVLQPGSGLTRQCFETGEAVVSDDAAADPRVQLSVARSLQLRSVLAVPIRSAESVLGVVEVLSSRPSAFDEMHVRALERAAGALASLLAPQQPVIAVPAEPEAGLSRGKLILLLIVLGLLGLLFGLWLNRRSGAGKPIQLVSAPSSPNSSVTQNQPNPQAEQPANAPPAPSPSNAESSAPVKTGPAAPSPVVPAPLKSTPPAPAPPPTPSTRAERPAPIPQVAPENSGAPTPPPAPEVAAALPPAPIGAAGAPSALISPAIVSPQFALEHTLNAHAGWVTSVAFTAGGRRLAAADWDKAIHVWDISSGQQMGAIGSQVKGLEAVAASPDGRWIAGENASNTVTIWDTASGREVHSFAGHKPFRPDNNHWVYSIAFSPDGRQLAAALDDKTVRVWEVESGRTVRDLEGHRRSIMYVAFSPDGARLATGGEDKSIQIWNLATGRVEQTLIGHKKTVCAVAFSLNGRWLASGSRDNSVKLWDLATGHEIRTLTGHRDAVTTLAFSPDSRWLASGSWDNTIRIWDAASGRELETLSGHARHVYTVAIDSRGRWLASGSEDGAIRLWQVKAPEQKQ